MVRRDIFPCLGSTQCNPDRGVEVAGRFDYSWVFCSIDSLKRSGSWTPEYSVVRICKSGALHFCLNLPLCVRTHFMNTEGARLCGESGLIVTFNLN